ncbi:unnamed protein product [Brachionus calyciflorus]|uniref:Uncharacterized protein n=1 Tax=Brachionus calyciflorus TaxID=104777 RepID=A0A814G937_9BILA|nr:unnamed protein product [Brachionus calyciflorus]
MFKAYHLILNFLTLNKLFCFIDGQLNFESSYGKVNSIGDNFQLANETNMTENFWIRNKFHCLGLCSQNENCFFVQYKQNNCSLFYSVMINDLILDGTFWHKKILIKEEYPGLTTNYPLSYLISLGFTLIYDQYYSHATTSAELDNIKSQCLVNSILCVAGGLVNTDILQLVSCANCHSLLTPTELDKPVFVGSAYWYRTQYSSFGFSPVYFIYQSSADYTDFENPLRLSWHLDGGGGWRLDYISGLIPKYSICSLINNGFLKVLDQFYSFNTTTLDLMNARSNCNSNSILCAAGGLVNSDILELVACGNCFQIMTNTTLNTPKLVGSVYWYLTPGKSFGFSPSFTISQTTSDQFNLSDPQRLSWHLDQPIGGWRLGNLSLNDNSYRKVLLVKN